MSQNSTFTVPEAPVSDVIPAIAKALELSGGEVVLMKWQRVLMAEFDRLRRCTLYV